MDNGRTGIQALNRLLRDLGRESPCGYAVGLHIRFAAPLITAHTYDKEWLRLYTENAYALRDPMVFWGLSHTGATRWSEIVLPDPFGIFKQAARHGLTYGCAVACGPLRSRTIVGAPDAVTDVALDFATLGFEGETR